MRKRTIVWLTGGGALLVAAMLFLSNGEMDEAKGDATRFKELAVRRGKFRIVVSSNGLVKPIDRIEIKSKASGTVELLPVEVGDPIRKGDLIARLDQKDEKADYEQARANLDIAEAELKQAQSTFNRRDQLFQKNLISEEQIGEIELNLAIARGKLVQAKTALERAAERLNEAIVRAPKKGTILQKYVEEGQIIASGVSSVSGGTPIADIADMTIVHIEAGVDEIDIGKVSPGQTATVIADAYPQLHFAGKIVRIAPEAIVEQNVTLFNVIVEVENKEGKLKSGMNASVEITIMDQDDVLLAPAAALKSPPERRNNGKKQMIALVKQDSDFVPRPVETGASNFKEIIIVSGLQEGDILGIPLVSRLKDDNDRREQRIRSSRSFGTDSK